MAVDYESEGKQMITFYRIRPCNECDVIQDALREFCFVYETIILESPDELPSELAKAGPPPILVDERDVFVGAENIISHLEELDQFKELWYKYQSDACYCDEQGNVE